MTVTSPLHPQHARPSPTTLINVSEVLTSLAALEDEEQELSHSLSELLSSRQPVFNAFAALQSLSPQVDSTCQDAALLARKVAVTAETADRIGSKVGRLDEEMRRVKSAVERVGKTMELKSSLSDLHHAIESRDWEAAARHCARAMSFPPEILTGPFSDLVVPTSEYPVPPLQALEEARETLRDTFLRQFEQASNSRDASEATRFFKLFPTIGWELEGLNAYAAFVSKLIHIEPPPSSASSPLYFVAALTALFESVCSIVDHHQAIVTKHYGKDRMQHVVRRLIEECDSIVERQLENWEEQRGMKRLAIHVASNPIVTVKDPSSQQIRSSDPVDPRDVDKILNETSSLIVRFSAFRRFLYNNALEPDEFEDKDTQTPRPSKSGEHELEKNVSDQAQSLLTSIDKSECNHQFEGIITKYYVPLELWYFRSATHQAHRLFSVDVSSSPPTSTVPDLVFYLLKAVLQRALGTGSLKVATSLLPRIHESLENDYIGVLKWKFSEVYRASAVMSTNAQTEKAERERRFSLVVLLNDLDVSALHLERLIEDTQQGTYIQDAFLDLEADQAVSLVKSLRKAVSSFRTTIKTAVDQVVSQLVRPRLRTLPNELFKDVTYVLDEDAFSSADYQDLVRKRFIKSWEGLVDGFAHVFTDANYLLFVEIVVDALVKPLEKVILSMHYSELGAIRFDRDIRAIVSHLSSHTTFGGIREKFLRLQQISTLLNIDKEEDLDEFYTGSGIAWKLSISDARKIVSLRT